MLSCSFSMNTPLFQVQHQGTTGLEQVGNMNPPGSVGEGGVGALFAIGVGIDLKNYSFLLLTFHIA